MGVYWPRDISAEQRSQQKPSAVRWRQRGRLEVMGMKYPKIVTVYKRDPETKYRTLLEGVYAKPEFEYLANAQWLWTEKIDGTNIRITSQDGQIRFGGRTDRAQIPTSLLSRLQNIFSAEAWAKVFTDDEGSFYGDSVILYGEGYGARIQKGGGNYIPDGVDFILFDVRVGELWLRFEDVLDIGQKLVLRVVPVIGIGTLQDAVEIVREGFYSRMSPAYFVAEGLVMKPTVTLLDRRGNRVITKIKHKDFPR